MQHYNRFLLSIACEINERYFVQIKVFTASAFFHGLLVFVFTISEADTTLFKTCWISEILEVNVLKLRRHFVLRFRCSNLIAAGRVRFRALLYRRRVRRCVLNGVPVCLRNCAARAVRAENRN